MGSIDLFCQGGNVIFESQCAARLKSERKRLSLNQSQVAELCGVARETWGKYERGQIVPGGDVLLGFALAGGNVQYVLTGESSGVVLTRDEIELVQHFRDAPLAVKAAAFAALTAGSAATDSKAINVSGSGHRIAGRDYNEHKK
ncbi:helix-turn-helix transcriptional regulator [Serratia rubidaea]|uniref:helix-turn-helix domain-containing protein n=1 Tax=Serratia rubidaea TaxID=61652 RepID=UPI001F3F31E2|nr:helix-turn-helix transcriptional regulator [Serratia rubidaea]UJD79847.1 helix-turn-helix transcriptional regulator [Serratia rubidaea]UJD84403.1 helix-turn-helix transcriptional regulator [Serratia rubidaea]